MNQIGWQPSNVESAMKVKPVQEFMISLVEDVRGPNIERRRKTTLQSIERVIRNIDGGPDQNILKLFAAGGFSHTNPQSWYSLLGIFADFLFDDHAMAQTSRGGVKPKWVKKISARSFERDFVVAVSSNTRLSGIKICEKMKAENPLRYANVSASTILREIPKLKLSIPAMKAKAESLG